MGSWGLRFSQRGLRFSPWGLRFSPRGLRSSCLGLRFSNTPKESGGPSILGNIYTL